MKLKNNWAKFTAEAMATFGLVFAGTGAIAANDSSGLVTHIGVSLVFGFVVLAMIYAVGHISGAHMNPAVTLSFASVGRTPWKEVGLYWAAQFIGGVLASIVVRLIFVGSHTIGMTWPHGSNGQSFALELVLTFILMFVIMGVAHDDRAEGLMAGVAIGSTVAFEALLGGPISGASMNPIRSLAPALVLGQLRHVWIYLVAPTLGALLGAHAYNAVRCDTSTTLDKKTCC